MRIPEATKRNKFIAIIIAALLIGAILYFGFSQNTTTSSSNTTTQVTNGTIVNSITEDGEVLSTGNTDVTSTKSGTVTEVYVSNDDTVSVGQNLFYVDSTATDEEIASAYSQYLAAVKNYNTAVLSKKTLESQVEAAKQAVYDAQDAVDEKNEKVANGENNPKTNEPYTQNEQDSIDAALNSAQLSLEAKEMDLDNADQSIAAAQASLDSAEVSYEATQDGVVTSPAEGLVQNIAIAAGDTVSASGQSSSSSSNSSSSTSSSVTSSSSTSSSGTSSALMTIKTNSEVWLQTEISEVDIAKINIDQTAIVTFDAIKNNEFNADVERIDTTGTNNSGVVTYNIYLKITNATEKIRPGMTATVSIETEKKEDVLIVPNSAIKSYRDGKAVQIYGDDGTVVYQPVEIGLQGDSYTEITSGLNEGDIILTSNTQDTGSSSDDDSSNSNGMPGGGAGMMMMGR